MTATAPMSRPVPATTALPTVLVEPFDLAGPVPPGTSAPEALRVLLIQTFARFEDVNVVSEPTQMPGWEGAAAASAADYRFTTTVAFDHAGMNFTFRLIDVAAGTVAWTKSYAGMRIGEDPSDASLAFLGEISATLLHPIGVVATRERVKQATRAGSDRYRCFLEAHDYLRSFVHAQHAKVRACLEEAVAADPSFAAGWVALARVYLREHQFSENTRPGDTPPLERAKNAARRAIEINPQSARAHFVMFDILAGVGDIRGVRSYGEKAIALNPYDPSVVFHYGAQLVMLGDVDAGVAIINRVAANATVPPARLDFALFMASYLKGDMEAASRSAKRITNEAFLPGYVARALAAFRTEGPVETRQALDRLSAIDPAWRTDPRVELSKFITSPAVVDRFANDLALAGLWTPVTASQGRQNRGLVQ
jgi:Tfp pilus assembly protein PilF